LIAITGVSLNAVPEAQEIDSRPGRDSSLLCSKFSSTSQLPLPLSEFDLALLCFTMAKGVFLDFSDVFNIDMTKVGFGKIAKNLRMCVKEKKLH
jgi:hypothetical protein